MFTHKPLLATIALLSGGLGIALMGIPAVAATTTTSTLSPTDDADVIYERTTVNNGSAKSLRAGRSSGETRETYVKFTVGTLAAQTAITKATLRLSRDTELMPSGMQLWSLKGIGWTEKTLTSGNSPAHSALVTTVNPSSSAASVDFDLTSIVKVPGTYALSLTSPNGSARFYSKEAGSQGPQLLLTMTSTATPSPSPTTVSPTPTTPSPSPTTVSPTPTTPSPSPTTASREAQVLSLVNSERQKAGCADLQADSRLATSARLHSEDMIKRNFFSHTNPDGAGPKERMVAAGFPVRLWGENIAAGQATPTAVMKAWMDSSGHRANILNCGFKYLGVGVADGGSYRIYWTQNFAS